MAVPKKKTTRSKKGKRCSQDKVIINKIMFNKFSNENHFKYFITSKGYYKDKIIIYKKIVIIIGKKNNINNLNYYK